MPWFEINFDGLPGPTHNYSGLAIGNLASAKNRDLVSHPKRAALQGLKKMRMMFDLGIQQAILPPQLRPDIQFLRSCGFQGSVAEILLAAGKSEPALLAAASSSAFMWTANAGTVSPTPDSTDGKLHFTPANLLSGLHRSLEAKVTFRVMRAILADDHFCLHQPLIGAAHLADEGAANHMRLTPSHGEPGIEIFVYGKNAFMQEDSIPVRFPARQTLQASQAVARKHQLNPRRVLFWRQNGKAIDSGAFHNDVVAVANENVLLCHELAFEDQSESISILIQNYQELCGQEPVIIQVPANRVSLDEAVQTYLFNSQLVTIGHGAMALIAPIECEQSESVRAEIGRILDADNPVQQVLYPDVRQSMQNGGGPACLRLRLVVNEHQLSRIHPAVRFSPDLESKLLGWVEEHYRDEISPDDLQDPRLYQECHEAQLVLESLLEFPAGVLVPSDS